MVGHVTKSAEGQVTGWTHSHCAVFFLHNRTLTGVAWTPGDVLHTVQGELQKKSIVPSEEFLTHKGSYLME